MKTIKLVFLVLIALNMAGFAQSPKSGKGKTVVNTDEVSVYYFHFNTRCVTCRAVEAEAKNGVEELSNSDVSFAAYNLDEKEGEAKGKEVGVESQMLLIVKGDKKINLTNEGFMYARTDPEKFKQIIKGKIESLF